jgi:hypothetical protein
MTGGYWSGLGWRVRVEGLGQLCSSLVTDYWWILEWFKVES